MRSPPRRPQAGVAAALLKSGGNQPSEPKRSAAASAIAAFFNPAIWSAASGDLPSQTAARMCALLTRLK